MKKQEFTACFES